MPRITVARAATAVKLAATIASCVEATLIDGPSHRSCLHRMESEEEEDEDDEEEPRKRASRTRRAGTRAR